MLAGPLSEVSTEYLLREISGIESSLVLDILKLLLPEPEVHLECAAGPNCMLSTSTCD
jgi:hypothetical protein